MGNFDDSVYAGLFQPPKLPASPPPPPTLGAASPLPTSPAGPPAPGVVAGAPSGGAGGFDLGQLLRMLPLILTRNNAARAAFLKGWQDAEQRKQENQREEQKAALYERQLDEAAQSRQVTQEGQQTDRALRLQSASTARINGLLQDLAKIQNPDVFKTTVDKYAQLVGSEFGPEAGQELLMRARQTPAAPINTTAAETSIKRMLRQVTDDEKATALLKGSQWKDSAYQLGYLLDDEAGNTLIFRDPEPAKPKVSLEEQLADPDLSPQDRQRILAAMRDAAGAKREPKEPKPEEPVASAYSLERMQRTLASVDELLPQINAWNTGFGSYLLKDLPTTQAKYFKAQLDTLASNIAFGELTAMREASKTGGALGQVSDRESRLLSSALGAIADPEISADQMRAQLQKIKASIERWYQAMNAGVEPANDRVRVQGPNGETGTVPKGTALPSGWKAIG